MDMVNAEPTGHSGDLLVCLWLFVRDPRYRRGPKRNLRLCLVSVVLVITVELFSTCHRFRDGESCW